MGQVKEIMIQTEYITLGQFLKLANCIDSGGHAKVFLQQNHVQVNGEPEQRRGRKLRDMDSVFVKGIGSFRVVVH